MASAVAGFLDLDLQLPSAKQINFATDIARELGVNIPAEVLPYRGACKEFIEHFIGAFHAKRAGKPV